MPKPATLTPREFQVAQRFWMGESGLLAAGSLGITPHALRQYAHRAYRKLGIHSREELVAWFGELFPTRTRQRRGYLEACAHMVEGWLARTEIAHARRSAESFMRRPEAAPRSPKSPIVTGKTKPEDLLTVRQLQTCQLLAEGKTAEVSAALLGVGKALIKKMISQAAAKVGAENRIELALWFTAKYPNPQDVKDAMVLAVKRARKKRHDAGSKILRKLGR